MDDRRVLSGVIFVNRNGLRRGEIPRGYGPDRTFCNRRKPCGKSIGYGRRRYKRRNRIGIMFGRLRERRVASARVMTET
ncbi:hypothetical protein AOE01nite_04740 [Acetobacter oeni]|uniref:Uncharacterized protein n=1 Tax=Acetobacter oeni TaxID=304077 RepID=A0A511XH23_9PROT|nr:transposase [Acetobacter oeni]GBR09379.1 transposase [Acetobacter oeni LMG 21952]GEN62250.1 hypothetical protein AOE01nite_04740 [Acetobacter oeni]